MKPISSDVQVTQIRPASLRGSRGGIQSSVFGERLVQWRYRLAAMIQGETLNTPSDGSPSFHALAGTMASADELPSPP